LLRIVQIYSGFWSLLRIPLLYQKTSGTGTVFIALLRKGTDLLWILVSTGDIFALPENFRYR
jgi:hypothetical protein